MPKLNTELLLKVADKLDSLKGKRAMLYDQMNFSAETECGTAHCIGGWTAEICNIDEASFRLEEELGVPPFEIWKLDNHIFSAQFMSGSTPQQVAARLREFAQAGRIRFRKSDFPQ